MRVKAFDYDFSKREIGFIIIIILLLAATGYYAWTISRRDDDTKPGMINSFETCIAAGNLSMDSFPEQCEAEGQTYVKGYKNFADSSGKYLLRYPNEWVQTFSEQYGGTAPNWSRESRPAIFKPNEAGNIEGLAVYASDTADLAEGIRAEWAADSITAQTAEEAGTKTEYAKAELTEQGNTFTQHTWLKSKDGKTVSLVFTEKYQTESDDNDYDASRYLPQVEAIVQTVQIL